MWGWGNPSGHPGPPRLLPPACRSAGGWPPGPVGPSGPPPARGCPALRNRTPPRRRSRVVNERVAWIRDRVATGSFLAEVARSRWHRSLMTGRDSESIPASSAAFAIGVQRGGLGDLGQLGTREGPLAQGRFGAGQVDQAPPVLQRAPGLARGAPLQGGQQAGGRTVAVCLPTAGLLDPGGEQGLAAVTNRSRRQQSP